MVREERKQRCKDGSIVDVRIIRTPLIVKGKRIGSFAIYEDITARSRAENAKRQAEDRFRRIFENAVEGIFQTTPDGTYLSVNPALARMYGYASSEELMGTVRDIGAVVYADPQRREEFKRIIAERGVVERFDYQVRRRDGSLIWISENARAVRDSKWRDCFLRRNGGRHHRAQAHRNRAAGDHENNSQHERDAQSGRSAAFDSCSAERSALRGKLLRGALRGDIRECSISLSPWTSTIPPSPPLKIERSCTDYVFRTGRPMIITQTVFDELAASGELKLVGTPSATWIGVPLRTPDQTIGVLVLQHYEDGNAYTKRDLDFLSSIGGQIAFAIERKRSEERARESEARLRVLIEQLPAVLWTVDQDLRFTSALGAGLARMGLKPDEIVGVPLHRIFQYTRLAIRAHRGASSRNCRRAGYISIGMEGRIVRVSRGASAGGGWATARRHLHGAGRNGP